MGSSYCPSPLDYTLYYVNLPNCLSFLLIHYYIIADIDYVVYAIATEQTKCLVVQIRIFFSITPRAG